MIDLILESTIIKEIINIFSDGIKYSIITFFLYLLFKTIYYKILNYVFNRQFKSDFSFPCSEFSGKDFEAKIIFSPVDFKNSPNLIFRVEISKTFDDIRVPIFNVILDKKNISFLDIIWVLVLILYQNFLFNQVSKNKTIYIPNFFIHKYLESFINNQILMYKNIFNKSIPSKND